MPYVKSPVEPPHLRHVESPMAPQGQTLRRQKKTGRLRKRNRPVHGPGALPQGATARTRKNRWTASSASSQSPSSSEVFPSMT